MAAEVDRKYIRESGASGIYPMMYYTHNLHFESAAAAMAGRHVAAKKAGDALFAAALPDAVHEPMMEAYLLQPAFVGVRFKAWDDVRKMEDPGPRLPLLRAIWLYARGAAAADQRDLDRASALRDAYIVARDAVPASSLAGPQNSGASLLAVATSVLDARLAEAAGDSAAALASWEKAVSAEDALNYDEPPAWYYPVRESHGAALLRAGRAVDAVEGVPRRSGDSSSKPALAPGPRREPEGAGQDGRRGLRADALRRRRQGRRRPVSDRGSLSVTGVFDLAMWRELG